MSDDDVPVIERDKAGQRGGSRCVHGEIRVPSLLA